MTKEIQIIRYLLDEIEERKQEIKEFDELDAEAYKKNMVIHNITVQDRKNN